MTRVNLLNDHIQWIRDHEWYFTTPNRSITREEIAYLFVILSWIEGKNKVPTGCGRCVQSAKERVWAEYKKLPTE